MNAVSRLERYYVEAWRDGVQVAKRPCATLKKAEALAARWTYPGYLICVTCPPRALSEAPADFRIVINR
jgi:hypothetical protein